MNITLIHKHLPKLIFNMMKKVFIFAIAAMSLAACSKDVTIQTSQSDDINFNVVLGKATKATETTKSVLDASDGFYAYAYRGDGEANKYFGPVVFKYNYDGATDDKYHPTDGNSYQYPDKTSTLYFYAYYPEITTANYGADAVFSAATTRPRIKDISPNSDITSQQDIIIANNSGTHSTSTVAMNFKHILSQIDIKVKNSNTTYVYTVKGVRINGVLNKASFIYPTATTPSISTLTLSTTDNYDYASADYQELANIGQYDHSYASNTSDQHVANGTAVSVVAGKTETGIGTFMVLPQDLHAWDVKHAPADTQWDDNNYKNYRGAYIAVLLEIKDATGTVLYPTDSQNTGWVAVPIGNDSAADDTWEPGKKYTYTLDFSKGGGWIDPTDPKDPGEEVLGNEILFTVTVDPWDETTEINWINS